MSPTSESEHTVYQMSEAENPTAHPDLDVNEVADGLVVYDGRRDRVHYLNITAGVVFSLCTGDMTSDVIADEVGRLFDLGRRAEPETTECLEHLRVEGLIS
jgi:hypothetical protein